MRYGIFARRGGVPPRRSAVAHPRPLEAAERRRRRAPISHHLAAEARNRPAITALRLLAVLNVGFKNVGARHAVPEVAERRTPCN